MMFKMLAICIIATAAISACVLAVTDAVSINVNVEDAYESYTKAVPCICDVLVEKHQGVIVNQTVIGWIWNSSDAVWE